jgi:hypothetical protein
VLAAAAFTLIVIPVAYRMIAGRSGSTLATSRALDRELERAEGDAELSSEAEVASRTGRPATG